MIDRLLGTNTPYGKLDPRVATLLKLATLLNKQFYNIKLSPRVNRKLFDLDCRMVRGRRQPVFKIIDSTIPPEIKIRIYKPSDSPKLPIIVFYHGGGWIVGNINTHDFICRNLAVKSSSIVVSVDYRLAPESKFPAAVNDAYEALLWVSKNALSIGGDPERIAVAGDSAGGNLTIVVCLMSRDRSGPKIAYQVPMYPATNMAQLNTESYQCFGEGYYLTKPVIEAVIPMYIGDENDLENPYASPLLATDFKNLPPALVITAQFDPFRDEGEAYARKLTDAGIPARIRRFDGLIHGFVSFGGILPQANDAINEIAAELAHKWA
jgi:acetyl esterase